MLGASLAVKIHTPPINSLEELVNSDHPVLVENGTSVFRLVILLDFETKQNNDQLDYRYDFEICDVEKKLIHNIL